MLNVDSSFLPDLPDDFNSFRQWFARHTAMIELVTEGLSFSKAAELLDKTEGILTPSDVVKYYKNRVGKSAKRV